LFCLFPTVYFGGHLNIREVKYFQANRFRVETQTPFDVYADGEYVCRTPVEIRVAPKILHVIVNPSSGEGARLRSAKLQLESTPPGADIAIDGSFVGNAPSDLQVTEGEHTVSVKKAGFKDWERKVKVSGGSSIRLSAELEKTQNQ